MFTSWQVEPIKLQAKVSLSVLPVNSIQQQVQPEQGAISFALLLIFHHQHQRPNFRMHPWKLQQAIKHRKIIMKISVHTYKYKKVNTSKNFWERISKTRKHCLYSKWCCNSIELKVYTLASCKSQCWSVRYWVWAQAQLMRCLLGELVALGEGASLLEKC